MKNCILKPLLFIFSLLLSVLIFSSCNNGESNVILTDDNTDNTTALDSECTNDSYTTDSDSTVDELTTEEIRAEIDDIKGTISNEEIVLGISEFAEENIARYEAYLERLEEMLSNKEE